MADEATGTQQTGDQATMVVPDAAQIITDQDKTDGIVDTGAGLFADEVRATKDQLTGEEGTVVVETPGTTKSATSQPAGDKTSQEPEKTGTTGAESQTVPLAALHEERSKRQQRDSELAAERERIASLEAEVIVLRQKAETPATPAEMPPEFKDFKLLSDEEFDALTDEDTVAAQKYLLRHQRYLEWKRGEDAKQEATKARMVESNKRVATIIQSARDDIASNIPGIYDVKEITLADGTKQEATPVSDALIEFAQNSGMDVDYLAAITDPATRIVVVGADGKPQTLLAGKGAASLLKGIYTLYGTVKGSATMIDKEAAKRAGEIIAQKIRTDTGFRSIGDAPGTGDIPQESNKIYTEDDLFNMRNTQDGEAKRRAYLGG